MRELAKLGAQQTLEVIFTEFPELRPATAVTYVARATQALDAARASAGGAAPPKRTMSKKNRALTSKRMRAYWRARRRAEAAA